jgi:hypothetical protein
MVNDGQRAGNATDANLPVGPMHRGSFGSHRCAAQLATEPAAKCTVARTKPCLAANRGHASRLERIALTLWQPEEARSIVEERGNKERGKKQWHSTSCVNTKSDPAKWTRG